MTVAIFRPRTTRSSYRLLRGGQNVWRIVDDRAPKRPVIGGVSLVGQGIPASKLDAPFNPNPWHYQLRGKVARPARLNQRQYGSDDPYQAPVNLRDLHHGGGKGQPAWLKPNGCWPAFGRIPVRQADYERPTWLSNHDPEGYRPRGRKQLHSGKRAPQGGPFPPHGTWHVETGGWSTRQTACSICWAKLPDGRRHFCSDDCARAGDLLRRRRRRSIKSGRWPEPRYEKRTWSPTRDELADLQLLHLEVRRRIGPTPEVST
jgi:hypothetical protein